MALPLSITGNDLTIEQFSRVVLDYLPVRLAPAAQSRMKRSHKLIEKFACEERPVYGINTGFGKFSDVHIGRKKIEALQLN